MDIFPLKAHFNFKVILCLCESCTLARYQEDVFENEFAAVRSPLMIGQPVLQVPVSDAENVFPACLCSQPSDCNASNLVIKTSSDIMLQVDDWLFSFTFGIKYWKACIQNVIMSVKNPLTPLSLLLKCSCGKYGLACFLNGMISILFLCAITEALKTWFPLHFLG